MNVQSKICSGVLAAALLAGSALAPALAQPADAGAAQAVEVERDDDDGFDWGLLGLLGLLGLIPRKRHDTHVHHDTTRPGAR